MYHRLFRIVYSYACPVLCFITCYRCQNLTYIPANQCENHLPALLHCVSFDIFISIDYQLLYKHPCLCVWSRYEIPDRSAAMTVISHIMRMIRLILLSQDAWHHTKPNYCKMMYMDIYRVILHFKYSSVFLAWGIQPHTCSKIFSK